MSLFLIAALPFLGAVFPALLIRAGRNASASAAGMTTFLAFVGLLINAPAVMRGEVAPLITGVDGVRTLAATQAVLESGQSKQPIVLAIE